MPIDYPSVVYEPAYAVFARSVTFNPLASQPGQPTYVGRGIFNTVPIDMVMIDGSIASEQRTILDVLETEFTVVPIQHDLVTIPADGGMPALGTYEVIEVVTNGGGETTLTLRKIVASKP